MRGAMAKGVRSPSGPAAGLVRLLTRGRDDARRRGDDPLAPRRGDGRAAGPAPGDGRSPTAWGGPARAALLPPAWGLVLAAAALGLLLRGAGGPTAGPAARPLP